MLTMIMILLFLFGIGFCELELNPDLPPGKNFDLSHWLLQSPKSNDDCEEISPSELETYQSPYFYTDKHDGSMTFYVESTDCTTSGSHYPRSELRQDCDPSADKADFRITDGEYILNGTYRIDKNITSDRTIIQQVKGESGELIKTYWKNDNNKGQIYIQENSSTDTNLAEVGFDEFNMYIIVNKGNIKIYVNGENKYDQNVRWNGCVYFKSGDYLQSDATDKEYIIVHVYELEQIVNGPCYSKESNECKTAN